MYYSILIYGPEGLFERLSAAEQDAVMQGHRELQARLAQQSAPWATAQLMPTTAAVTLRQSRDTVAVLDGPFAETKEQFLGFYLIECESMEQAIEAARLLPLESWAVEVRPVSWLGGLSQPANG